MALYKTTLRIRPKTFFKNIIEPNKITSNHCYFSTVETFDDGTEMIYIDSDDEDIIDKINKLYEAYDFNHIEPTIEENEISNLKDENLYLGQLITDLELTVLELQLGLGQMKVDTQSTTQDLGTQITDLDLGLLEHKITDHA